MLNTPVLFLVFNRPDTTIQVFEKIREAKPKQLFVAADGPRDDREGEKEKCEKVRSLILDNIDWDCEVKTLFRDSNLGCGKAVSQAITWFFEQVEMGIVLEDDTLPDASFFPFCEELLIKYKDDNKITSIAGVNFLSSAKYINEDYIFSNYPGIWGWAAWRRSWNGYDIELKKWAYSKTKFKFLFQFGMKRFLFFDSIFKRFYRNEGIDTWDYQWWFHQLEQGLGIIPAKNMIKNIGFNEDATHTVVINNDLILSLERTKFPLNHLYKKQVNNRYEVELYSKYYLGRKMSFFNMIKGVVASFVN